jgi:hypothetical protein
MLNHPIFVLGFSFVLVHEMDAIRLREWKILPVLSRLDDSAGYLAFVSLHVPLYFVLLLVLFGGVDRTLILVLDAFFVLHLVLHLRFHRSLFPDRPNDRRKSALSWTLIWGAGICGALDVLIP